MSGTRHLLHIYVKYKEYACMYYESTKRSARWYISLSVYVLVG
jgi:hypothetical protein